MNEGFSHELLDNFATRRPNCASTIGSMRMASRWTSRFDFRMKRRLQDHLLLPALVPWLSFARFSDAALSTRLDKLKDKGFDFAVIQTVLRCRDKHPR